MNTTKPKSRKVAWVVLGVVVLGAAISIAVVWDQVWLKIAYIPTFPARDGPIPIGGGPAELRRMAESLAPPNVKNKPHSVFFCTLRFRWLPGPACLCVFYDESGVEVFRSPTLIGRMWPQ